MGEADKENCHGLNIRTRVRGVSHATTRSLGDGVDGGDGSDWAVGRRPDPSCGRTMAASRTAQLSPDIPHIPHIPLNRAVCPWLARGSFIPHYPRITVDTRGPSGPWLTGDPGPLRVADNTRNYATSHPDPHTTTSTDHATGQLSQQPDE